MKQISLILILLFANLSFSQEKIPESHIYSQIINEVQVSGNFSAVINSNTRNKFGGGIGIFHVFFEPALANIVVGLEYNFTSQYCESIRYDSDPKTTYTNVNIRMHNFSLPLLVRFCVGKKTKALFEFGGFLEASIAKGFGDSYTWNLSGIPSSKGNEYGLSTGLNGGLQAAVGFKIRLNKTLEMPFLLTYRHGFRKFAYDFQNQYLKLAIGLNWARKYEPEVKWSLLIPQRHLTSPTSAITLRLCVSPFTHPP